MDTIDLRQKIHEYVDKADDRIINLIYAIVQADLKDDNYKLSEAHKSILDKRIAEHEANPNSGASWEEVKNRVKSKL